MWAAFYHAGELWASEGDAWPVRRQGAGSGPDAALAGAAGTGGRPDAPFGVKARIGRSRPAPIPAAYSSRFLKIIAPSSTTRPASTEYKVSPLSSMPSAPSRLG